MKTIEIQGVQIPIKEFGCSLNGDDPHFLLDSHVNINVYITNDCNGSCKFCCNVNNDKFTFDFPKFKDFIYEILAITPSVKIKKITFTGGEPSLDLDNLHQCIQFLRIACKETKLVICTNGYLLWHIYYCMYGFDVRDGVCRLQKVTEIIDGVDNISMSRHHWDNKTNNKILGLSFESDLMRVLPDFSIREKINLSCNLIRGHIDTQEQMVYMLEYADSIGVSEVAFVKLMPINEYCETNKIEINALQEDANILGYEKWEYTVPNVCKCNSYVYRSKSNNLIKFYMRNNRCPTYNMGSYIIYKRNVIQNWY